MHPLLRLFEDTVGGAVTKLELKPLPRMIFVVHGTVTIDGRALTDGEAWHGGGAVELAPGKEGVTLWRYELAPPGGGGSAASGPGVTSREKLSAVLDTMPKGELLMRGDSVAFPPGGCAFPHRHAGPGIRCLIEGGIRIDAGGRSSSYGPGSPWFENGIEPVFAQAAADRQSRFIRVMILPRDYLGKSSFQFVNEADKTKPRVQQYKIYVDAPVELPKSP
jgi:hypothetical protein